MIFLADVNFFLNPLLSLFLSGRKLSGGGERRVLLTFPSDALVSLGKFDLTLDVSLGESGGLLGGVASIRRREDTEGNRNAGVKVQVDDYQVREKLFSNAFRLAERKTRRGLLLLV